MGNPTSDGTWTYTWKHGRQLASMTDGTTTISYTYNAEGLRIGKTVTRSNYSETHEYYYNNGNLTCDIITIVDNGETIEHYLQIAYDESGRPLIVTYDHKSYYYLLNAQGDVMGISGVYGDLKVAYTYDAWGNVLSVTGPLANTLGYWNPCRYRGYVYDKETGFYYLQSRYYNPEIGRWISPESNVYASAFDGGSGLIGYNVYAYCANNPVNFSDPTGESVLGTILLKVVIGAAVNILTTYIGAKATGQSYSWKDAGVAGLAGALGTGNTVLKVTAGVVSGLYTAITAYRNGADLEKAVVAGVVSAWGTTVSVSNIAGWTGSALDLVTSTVADIVFGTGANAIAAATYCASIETSRQQTGTQCASNMNQLKPYCERRLR